MDYVQTGDWYGLLNLYFIKLGNLNLIAEPLRHYEITVAVQTFRE